MGMDVELEHGLRDPLTNVTEDDPVVTGKIRLPIDWFDSRSAELAVSAVCTRCRLCSNEMERRAGQPVSRVRPDRSYARE
jgi:Protein of unknown function (DUF5661)